MKRVSQRWKLPGSNRRAALLLLVTASLLLTPWAASAQTVQQRLDAVSGHMKRLQDFSARLPTSAKEKLSSSAQHLLRAAARWDEMQQLLSRNGTILNTPLNGQPFHPQPGPMSSRQVSDPSTDLFSRMAGCTQSETSTAWCGHNVVVAYNDSGSLLESFPVPGIGLSFNGYSQSSNGGRSFTDQGYLNPGPNLANFLGGDPVAVCTDENTFYQSSIFSSSLSDTGVSVSQSTDGGTTFGPPVEAVSKDAFFHFIDKPWMAADPSNPNNLYVTYSDFDVSGTICGFRIGIELVRSTDGGATWSTSTVVDSGCFPSTDQGSNVAVDGAGNVYVAWEQFPAFIPTNEIDIAKSTNGGQTFAPKSTVAIVHIVGSIFGLLQGGFRNNEFPSLAIDLSRGGKGPLYIAWNDGVRKMIPDGYPPGLTGITYSFGDAVVSRSDNGGLSWSAPVTVNDDNSNAPSSPGADHFLPGIAVDNEGSVGVCFYDRRLDPGNFLIDRECANSHDRGRTWRNHRVTKMSFAPSIAADLLINPVYMGDYDGVAADSTGQSEGFLGAYGDNARGNPDVRITKPFSGSSDESDDN
jgi:hypothetical protein